MISAVSAILDSLDDIHCLQDSLPQDPDLMLAILEDRQLHALLEVRSPVFLTPTGNWYIDNAQHVIWMQKIASIRSFRHVTLLLTHCVHKSDKSPLLKWFKSNFFVKNKPNPCLDVSRYVTLRYVSVIDGRKICETNAK